MKQNKFTDKKKTEALIDLGLTPEDENGFQIHELINLIPDKIMFQKSFHYDGTIFIDWKKKKRFFVRIERHESSRWGYDLALYDNDKLSDNSQIDNQLVDLLADIIIYLKSRIN